MINKIRVACHVHSTWSYDGKWKLDQLARSFANHNYRVMLITEHDQGFDEAKRLEHRDACRSASNEKILLIPGIEYSDPTNVIHLLVWGDVPFVGSRAESGYVLTAAQESGGISVLAHPSRKEAWKRFNYSWSGMLLGIEFWNRKTDGWAPSEHAWALIQQTGSIPFAGLDFHDSRQFFPMATFLDLPGPISEQTVLGALRARRCIPKVFGLETPVLTNGLCADSLHRLESFRRAAAGFYRAALSKH